jgi:hypothetical protein
MNLPVSKPNEQLNFHFLLEANPDGQVVANVAELSDCQVIANTQAEAIAELEQKLHDRFAKITIVPFTLSINPEITPQRDNPWTEFMGMYKDDPTFAEIAAELRAERGLEHLGWVE